MIDRKEPSGIVNASTFTCPQCLQPRDLDDAAEAPCLSCGRCGVCVPTAGGCGGSEYCEDCAGEADGR